MEVEVEALEVVQGWTPGQEIWGWRLHLGWSKLEIQIQNDGETCISMNNFLGGGEKSKICWIVWIRVIIWVSLMFVIFSVMALDGFGNAFLFREKRTLKKNFQYEGIPGSQYRRRESPFNDLVIQSQETVSTT